MGSSLVRYAFEPFRLLTFDLGCSGCVGRVEAQPLAAAGEAVAEGQQVLMEEARRERFEARLGREDGAPAARQGSGTPEHLLLGTLDVEQ